MMLCRARYLFARPLPRPIPFSNSLTNILATLLLFRLAKRFPLLNCQHLCQIMWTMQRGKFELESCRGKALLSLDWMTTIVRNITSAAFEDLTIVTVYF